MRSKLSLLLNIIFIILEIMGIIVVYQTMGYFDIKFYTLDSNLFALIMAIFYLFKRDKLLDSLRLCSVVSVMITFLVVVFILIPLDHVNPWSWYLFGGANLYLHFLCPLLLMFIYLIFDKKVKYQFKDKLIAISFTIIYAVILIILNIFNIVDGPYLFLRVHNQPIFMSILWTLIIIGGAYLLINILIKLKNYKK